MITGDGQATATAIATMLGRGCQLYINEPHLFPKRPQFCKLGLFGKTVRKPDVFLPGRRTFRNNEEILKNQIFFQILFCLFTFLKRSFNLMNFNEILVFGM